MTIEEFYKDHFKIVYGYLLSLCGKTTMAEDLTSETFLRAIQKIDCFDGTCKMSTWLCTIARNLFLNEMKRQKRTIHIDDVEERGIDSFEEEFVIKEQARNVLKAAGTLKPVYRQVFHMRIHGLSFREIGNAMGKNENWARVTFYRAKTTLLNRLEESNGSM
ncbi:MAG TPA: RNA polymerase subunit sigma [Clostridiales bacterium]|nr:RNA polymerase subunit sigma [Clostridiales bacterium]